MDEFQREQLQRHPHWLAILQSYQTEAAARKQASPDFDGWLPRLPEPAADADATAQLATAPAPAVATRDSLSSILGKLIAYGFLKFDLQGREAGMRYQLTHAGRAAALGEWHPATDDSDEQLEHAA